MFWAASVYRGSGVTKTEFVKRLLGIAAASLLCANCGGVLDPHGPVGTAERVILLNSLGIMLAIVVPTIVLTLVFAWWFRASNTRARYQPDFVYSGRIEMVVWSIPVMVVLFLGAIAWIGSHDLDPTRALESRTEPLEVQVVSLDWNWLFIYPQDKVASVNRLIIPEGVPVRFRLTSATVMNAFFIPQLGSMIYAMNGMETKLHLQSDRVGLTRGLAAHYSGAGFADMNFAVDTLARAEFELWKEQTRSAGRTLDTAAYARLLEPTANLTPTTFGSVDPDLFDAIVRQTAPAAPGLTATK